MSSGQKSIKTLYEELERTGKAILAQQQKEKEIKKQLGTALDAEIMKIIRKNHDNEELLELLQEIRDGRIEIAFVSSDRQEVNVYDDFNEQNTE